MKTKNDDCIEIITVRLNACGDTRAFQTVLQELLKASAEESEPVSIELYKSEQVENDWAIHLRHPVAVRGGKSPLGINLAEVLHSVGLVHHKTWKSKKINSLQN